jgi:signal transduction histidine kinase
MPNNSVRSWRGSLRLRLFGGTALWITLALGLTTIALDGLFKDQATRQFEQQLQSYLYQIVVAFDVDAQGNPLMQTAGADPRFNRPESGLYWQINDQSGAVLLKSRSLWDTKLNVANDALKSGDIHFHNLTGPASQALIVAEQNVLLEGLGSKQFRVIVGSDTQALTRAIQTWQRSLWLFVGILFLSLLVAASAQVAFGLLPLRQLQRSLKALREGDGTRIVGAFPTELKPLIEDFNAVIDTNEKIIERARNQAGDLAHSIKTPISVMSNALRLEQARNHHDPALVASLQEQLQQLQQQVQWRLKRARIAASAGVPHARTPVKTTVEQLTRVMKKVHAEKSIQVTVSDIPADLDFAGELQDLQEILGNLLDNAYKWAAHTISVNSAYADGKLRLTIQDDGPGCLNLTESTQAPTRGQRADESIPGSGLGLSIARDLVGLYGGELLFQAGSPNGLRITLTLPGDLR